MKHKRNILFVWIFFGLIAVSNLVAIISLFVSKPPAQRPSLFELAFPIVPVFFAFVGAVIISRHPRNVIGLVMMIPGLSLTFVIDAYLAPYIIGQYLPPSSPSLLFLTILWFSNWNWFLLVTPIMYIMLLFPTGHPLSPRWKWLVYLGIGILGIFILMITFAAELSPGSGAANWRIPNPIGFLKLEWVDKIVAPLLVVFVLWIILSTVSLFVRFHKARSIERQQIKWLVFAGAIFVLFYAPSFIGDTYSQAENLWNILLPIGMMTFPVAIAIAILRYRLYDIDILIRRTLQYTILTGLLAFVYFGSVLVLQTIVETITGGQSPLVIVLSTLAIAALFNPLRIRIQEFIDRRFYRKKYDAEQTLANFAAAARDEVNLDQLSAALVGVLADTMQPEQISIWLKPAALRSSIPSSRVIK